MDAARIAMYGAAAFTIVLVGAVIYDEIAPPPTPDNAREVADFCLGDHSNIGVHYHPVIEIVVKGQQVTIPANTGINHDCLLYTSPSPRDVEESRMPSSA